MSLLSSPPLSLSVYPSDLRTVGYYVSVFHKESRLTDGRTDGHVGRLLISLLLLLLISN